MKLVIERATWLRGEGDESLLLRGRDQKMCCLGFFALEIGYSKEEIQACASPDEVSGMIGTNKWPHWLLNSDSGEMFKHTPVCSKLIKINDSTTLTEEERERGIRDIFGQHGVEVEFV